MTTSEFRRLPSTCPGGRVPVLSFRRVVRNSALLNLVVVLTSFPVLVAAGGPVAVAPALAIMAGISLTIWAFTFALFSFVSLLRLYLMPEGSGKPRGFLRSENSNSVADRWIDGPG